MSVNQLKNPSSPLGNEKVFKLGGATSLLTLVFLFLILLLRLLLLLTLIVILLLILLTLILLILLILLVLLISHFISLLYQFDMLHNMYRYYSTGFCFLPKS